MRILANSALLGDMTHMLAESHIHIFAVYGQFNSTNQAGKQKVSQGHPNVYLTHGISAATLSKMYSEVHYVDVTLACQVNSMSLVGCDSLFDMEFNADR